MSAGWVRDTQTARSLKERVSAWLASVSYRDWVFHLGKEPDGRLWLQVRFVADGEDQHGRKWMLSPCMTKSELIQTAMAAVITAQEHEAREHFLYRGKAVFGPHFNVDKLAELCTDGRALDVRAEPSFMADPLAEVSP